MKILKNKGSRNIKNPILTLGNFDGIHLGHRKIISTVARRAEKEGLPSVVYTFDPHPLKVVAPHKSPPLILDREDKIKRIEGLGIDYLVFAEFTKEFAATHPREFVEDVLVKGFGVKEVWVGHDFSFGKGRLGTAEFLSELGTEYGFMVFIVPAYKRGGHIVSSSRIRELIKRGEVEKAGRLLGGNYSIKGKVVKGKAIGKEIGFPTANLKAQSELVPKNGVYAAKATVGGRTFGAVINIGFAPTFGGKERRIEAHVLDFEDNIYGKKMEAVFLKRLRDEKTFASKDALVRQIRKDVERARKLI